MDRQITYKFEFNDSEHLRFDLAFDEKMNLVSGVNNESSEDWVKLSFCKCSNCPLDETKSENCPVAKSLHQIVEQTKDHISYAKAIVTVETPERDYVKKTDTQEGLLSLFGLVMSTSGCPHLDWFRPLARFHLPFSNLEETMFRILSMQLVDTFLNNEDKLKECAKIIETNYKTIEVVNLGLINRIQSHCRGDADANAIAALDLFAKLFSFEYESQFSSLRPFFSPK